MSEHTAASSDANVTNKRQRLTGVNPFSSSFRKSATRAAFSSLQPHTSPHLSVDQFVPLRKLGKGGFGSVFHVADKQTGLQYALKVIDKSMIKPQHVCLILQEQIAHRGLTASASPSFLPMHASWHDVSCFYMLTGLQSHGDLRGDIKRSGRYPLHKARVVAAELLLCLEDMHSRRIMHRDLKPDNVLIGNDGHIMLADFGMVKMFNDDAIRASWSPLLYAPEANKDDVTQLPCGTPRYMALEVLKGKQYSYVAEMWSVGVILHMMLTGRVPYKASQNDRKTQLELVMAQELAFVPGKLDYYAEDVIRGLLTKDPACRLTLSEAKCHPFFAEIDWATLRIGSGVLPHAPKLATNPIERPTLRADILLADSSHGGNMDADPYPRFTHTTSSFKHGRFVASLYTDHAILQTRPPRLSRPANLIQAGNLRQLFTREATKEPTRGREGTSTKENIEEWRTRHKDAMLVEARAPTTFHKEAERRAKKRDTRNVFGDKNL